LPSITVIVDLNGDQVPDIVSDRIYLGKGNGAFVAVAYPSVTPATTLGTAAIAMADFNNDSKMDLAILDGNGTLGDWFFINAEQKKSPFRQPGAGDGARKVHFLILSSKNSPFNTSHLEIFFGPCIQ
jgi:hypothetical protein